MMRRVVTISVSTFREAARSRLFLAVLCFALLCLLAVTPYAHATIGEPVFVVKSIGIAGASFGSILTVIITGATFLEKDLRRKTIVILLARPLRRWELLFGRFLGLALVGSLIHLLIIATSIGYCSLLEDGGLDLRLLWSIPGNISEVAIVAAMTIFFSTIVVTPILNGMAALCLFIAGRSHSWIETSFRSLDLPFLSILSSLVPDLEQLYAGNGLIYGEVPSTLKLLLSITYGMEFAVAVMCLSTVVFQRRDIP
jgi:ABC-type transport system involved in multi-copper enzyme maturation permease subunit